MIYEDYMYDLNIDYNICPLCGKLFVEGEPVNVIDLPKGPFLIVHKTCYEKRKAVGSEIEESFDENDENELSKDTILWRYMDLSKFVMMLKNSSLYFSSPNQFDDIYEGAHGELRNKKAWDDFYISYAKTAIITAPDNCWHKIDKDRLDNEACRIAEDITNNRSHCIFINCWHSNQVESEAMWKMYSVNTKNAVAIKTNVEKLKTQLGNIAKINRVKYVDYSKRFVSPNDIYWFKRLSFEYEKEVRAIVYDPEKRDCNGIEVEVNLSELIDGINISPYAPTWFQGLVDDILIKYGYNIKTKMSHMAEEPF